MKFLIAILFLIVLLPCVTHGATHVINSLPYTFDATDHSGDAMDTLILEGTKLVSATDGITLSSTTSATLENVVLLLEDDTLGWGQTPGVGYVGINITGSVSRRPRNIRIRGGYILHETTNSSLDTAHVAIQIGGIGVTLDSLKEVTMYGDGGDYDGSLVEGGGNNVYGIKVFGGTFDLQTTGYYSRCHYSPVFRFANLYRDNIINGTPNLGVDTLNGDTLHVIVDGVNIVNGPHMGILVSGYPWQDGDLAYSIIRNSNITTDARNDRYPTSPGTCFGSSNPYAVGLTRAAPGTRVHHNTFTSGTSYGGNRGVLIERGFGTYDAPVRIDHNTMYLHEGPNAEYGDGLSLHAVRIRYGPKVIDVDSNTITGVGDTLSSTTHIGKNIHLIRLSTDSSVNQDSIRIRVFGNTLNGILTENNIGADVTMFMSDANEIDSALWSYNNFYNSPGIAYKFGDFNGGSEAVVVHDDTVRFSDTTVSSTQVSFSIGYLGSSFLCDDNIARDIYYLNGATDSVEFSPNNTTLREIFLQSTLALYARGTGNGNPIVGAQVYVWNGSGDTSDIGSALFSGTSDSGGLVSGIIDYEYRAKTVTETTTDYNDFFVKYIFDGDTVWTVDKTVGWTSASKTDTADFAGVNGTGTWGSEGEPEVPDVLSSVVIDSIVSDFSGETDSVDIITVTGSGSTSDSIIIAYATDAYPDSNGVNRIAYAYVASTTDTNTITLDIEETATLYVSYWTRTDSDIWTIRGTVSEEFTAASVDNVSPSKIEDLIIIKNGVFIGQ